MLNAQVPNGILDDGGGAEVARMKDVCDIAVHEDVAGLPAEEGRFGDSGVGAADPENLRLLALGERREEIGLFLGGARGPFFVLG